MSIWNASRQNCILLLIFDVKVGEKYGCDFYPFMLVHFNDNFGGVWQLVYKL